MAITKQNSPISETMNQPLEPINQITRWFETAVPNPSDRNALTQIGVHFEEVSEMLQALRKAGSEAQGREQLTFAGDVLSYFQRQLKSGDLAIAFDNVDRVTLLDALCDQIVTAVGVAHMLGMDIEGALKEVASSNDSKFGEDGKPIFNEQSKIMKGPHYQSPDLTAYTLRRTQSNGREV